LPQLGQITLRLQEPAPGSLLHHQRGPGRGNRRLVLSQEATERGEVFDSPREGEPSPHSCLNRVDVSWAPSRRFQ
jgi:hypothetical protein